MNRQNTTSAYREIEIQGATPLQLVVAVYDVILQDIRRAIEAQRGNDLAKRTAHVKHCLMAIGQLQGRLDFERGGEVAKNLNHFYSAMRGKLLEASIKNSTEIFAAIANMIVPVRSAWNKAAKAQLREQRDENDLQAGVVDLPPAATEEVAAHCGWTA